jgi:hypothetical protein
MVTQVELEGGKLKFELTRDTQQWALKVSSRHSQAVSMYSTESEAVDALFQAIEKLTASSYEGDK